MNIKNHLLLALALAIPSTYILAQDSHTTNDTLTEEQIQAQHQEFNALNRFLNMPPERLEKAKTAINKISSMSEQEKEAMKEEIAAFRKKHPKQRYFEKHRSKLKEHFDAMSPEEAKAERNKIRSMSRKERRTYRSRILGENESPNHTQKHQQ